MCSVIFKVLPIEVLSLILNDYGLSLQDIAKFRISSKAIMNLVVEVNNYKNILNRLYVKIDDRREVRTDANNEEVNYVYQSTFEYRNLEHPLNTFIYSFSLNQESIYINFKTLSTCIKEGRQIIINIHEYLESPDISSPFQILIKRKNKTLYCIFKLSVFGSLEYTFEASQVIKSFTQLSEYGYKQLVNTNVTNTSIQELYKPDLEYFLSKSFD